ncbi:hypothetical protein DBY68_017845 [Pseudocitrobacter sp. RIT415]|nr:hypothetical protein DBY68_017845 [Pseudocitrobacter sp. RIT 415]
MMKIHYDSCFTSIRYMQFVNVRAQRSPGDEPVYFRRHSLWIAFIASRVRLAYPASKNKKIKTWWGYGR